MRLLLQPPHPISSSGLPGSRASSRISRTTGQVGAPAAGRPAANSSEKPVGIGSVGFIQTLWPSAWGRDPRGSPGGLSASPSSPALLGRIVLACPRHAAFSGTRCLMHLWEGFTPLSFPGPSSSDEGVPNPFASGSVARPPLRSLVSWGPCCHPNVLCPKPGETSPLQLLGSFLACDATGSGVTRVRAVGPGAAMLLSDRPCGVLTSLP